MQRLWGHHGDHKKTETESIAAVYVLLTASALYVSTDLSLLAASADTSAACEYVKLRRIRHQSLIASR